MTPLDAVQTSSELRQSTLAQKGRKMKMAKCFKSTVKGTNNALETLTVRTKEPVWVLIIQAVGSVPHAMISAELAGDTYIPFNDLIALSPRPTPTVHLVLPPRVLPPGFYLRTCSFGHY